MSQPSWPEIEWRGVEAAARRRAWRRGFAADLGVAENSLVSLGIGYDPHRDCALIPMRDGNGTCVGIQCRYRNGTKRTVVGSQVGYFGLPLIELREVRQHARLLVVTEGAGDCMAALSLGFLAVGRYSANPGERADRGAFAACAGMDVVVVQDVDHVGRTSARRFAEAAMLRARSVRLIAPPEPHKDLREWLRDGGVTRSQCETTIASAPLLRVVISEVAHAR